MQVDWKGKKKDHHCNGDIWKRQKGQTGILLEAISLAYNSI
jgi:hypothetical protein